MAAEFPQSDNQLWMLERKGLTASRARRQLAEAPDDPATLALLVEQGRVEDAVHVLRTIMITRTERLPAALAALRMSSSRVMVSPSPVPVTCRLLARRARSNGWKMRS